MKRTSCASLLKVKEKTTDVNNQASIAIFVGKCARRCDMVSCKVGGRIWIPWLDVLEKRVPERKRKRKKAQDCTSVDEEEHV